MLQILQTIGFTAKWKEGYASLDLRMAVQVLPMSVKVDLRRNRPAIELSDAELMARILEAEEDLATDGGEE